MAQEHIKKPVAEAVLLGKLSKGGVFKVKVKNGNLELDLAGPDNPRITGDKPPLLTAD